MNKIAIIRSGGQSGVDRAALDIAKKYKIQISGWCPKNGWAEDFPTAPGLLAYYPELKETPLEEPEQRTMWNVRDSHATLIISPALSYKSKGTALTVKTANQYGRPLLVFNCEQSISIIIEWLNCLPNELTLNIAGPRASEAKDIYNLSTEILSQVLEAFNIDKKGCKKK